jgi:hypothetical protein
VPVVVVVVPITCLVVEELLELVAEELVVRFQVFQAQGVLIQAAVGAVAVILMQEEQAVPVLSSSRSQIPVLLPSPLVLPAHCQQPYPALKFIQLQQPQLFLKP